MTNPNEFRMNIARRTAERMSADPNVKAILLTGSVAQSRATEKSDIDLILYHAEPIPKDVFKQQKAEAKLSGGDLQYRDKQRGFALYHLIEGVRVDIGFFYLNRTADAINDFLTRPDVNNMRLQTAFNGIVNGIPLYGDSFIEQWQKKLRSYPEPFRESMVAHFLRFAPLQPRSKNLAGLLFGKMQAKYIYYDRFLSGQRNLLGVLCGLNKKYHPGNLRDMDWHFKSMDIAPDNLLDRLKKIDGSDLPAGTKEFTNLVLELLDLIDQYTPGVDTGSLRDAFSGARA